MFRFLIALIVGAVLVFFSYPASSQNVKTYIPEKAYPLLPKLKSEAERLHPNGPSLGYYASLIEQESCISLKHSRCWSPTSRLKTSRETGAGLPQITVAYRADGSVRFDKLEEMRDNYVDELKELSWENVYERPDLQLRVVVLLTQENWKRFFMVKNYDGKLGFTDSAYNGGPRDVEKGRLICGLKKGCNPDLWFGNVEYTIPKSTKPLYGTRSAKDINLEHVYNVTQVRFGKYQSYFDNVLTSSKGE